METGIFCKQCGYDLRASAGRCPECGLAFDRSDPSSYRNRPAERWLWRWGRRAIAVMLLLILGFGGIVGWTWWGWKQEQPAIQWVKDHDGYVAFQLIGPAWVQERAGRWRWMLKRADFVRLNLESVGDESVEKIADLKELSRVSLVGTQVSGHGLTPLRRLRKLAFLYLRDTPVDDAALPTLETIQELRELDVARTKLSHGAVATLRRAHPDADLSSDYPDIPRFRATQP